MEIKPCKCGNSDLTVWYMVDNLPPEESMTAMEKIECSECGRVVYGSDDDSIDDWNNERYDE